MGSRRRITVALIGLVVLVVVGWFVRSAVDDNTGSQPSVTQNTATQKTGGLAVRPLSSLPKEAGDMWKLIQKGGPFSADRDGVVFENREKLLPAKPAGYYREYTVRTPGSDDRGARRLVYGQSSELYYTDDHYVSFIRVDPGK
jgi:guanyl-specific ribonuclease Sa